MALYMVVFELLGTTDALQAVMAVMKADTRAVKFGALDEVI